MTFLYSLAGDAHAVILHVAQGGVPKGWNPPSYVRLAPDETTKFFEQSLGNQCIYVTGIEG
jgi:hypothetical protein